MVRGSQCAEGSSVDTQQGRAEETPSVAPLVARAGRGVHEHGLAVDENQREGLRGEEGDARPPEVAERGEGTALLGEGERRFALALALKVEVASRFQADSKEQFAMRRVSMRIPMQEIRA